MLILKPIPEIESLIKIHKWNAWWLISVNNCALFYESSMNLYDDWWWIQTDNIPHPWSSNIASMWNVTNLHSVSSTSIQKFSKYSSSNSENVYVQKKSKFLFENV